MRNTARWTIRKSQRKGSRAVGRKTAPNLSRGNVVDGCLAKSPVLNSIADLGEAENMYSDIFTQGLEVTGRCCGAQSH